MSERTEIEEQKGGREIPGRKPGRFRVKRSAVKWILPLVAILLVAAGGLYWSYASVRESTDDAQIDGHLHPVSARIGGTVLKVLVQDNQHVEAGTPLVGIDQRDYKVALDLARANVTEAQAALHASRNEVPITSATTSSRLSDSQAGVEEVKAGIAQARKAVEAARARSSSAEAHVREAKANHDKASRDLERFKLLVEKDEISKQQYDTALAATETTRAQVDEAASQVREAQHGVESAEAQLTQQQARLAQAQALVAAARTAPEQVAAARAKQESAAARLEHAKAALEQAQLNLEYTVVRAPASGIISQRTVEAGQVVQPGQPLLSVVPLDVSDIWVTANFKETQLREMHPGQSALISVDAYGKEYRGHVESIAAVTGARSSLLPPENASGNYVKVVQRIPVKIVFDKGQDAAHLRPGMSVVATVLLK